MNDETKRVKKTLKIISKKKLEFLIKQIYLTEEEKYILIEHVLKGKPMNVVADELNISLRTCSSRLRNALIKISDVLKM